MKYQIINNEIKIKYTIKQIFKDNWYEFVQAMKLQNKPIRETIMREVAKIIDCQEPSKGYTLYVCPDCDDIKYVPFTCKSRFCNCCGVKYSQDRSLSITEKMLDCSHRHVVFTIPEILRSYFARDRKLLNLLFEASAETITYQFNKQNKTENFTPGMISTLHTFGRDLKWNPHIHMILTEGGIGNSGLWHDFKHMNYEGLRRSWQFCLLKAMKSKIKNSDFKILVDALYKNHSNGFYVRALPNKNMNNSAIANYITRYIGRPVMAQSRISNYTKDQVEFWYKPHGEENIVTENVSSFDFMSKLIIHIPDKNFKMLRYFGIYSVTSSKHKIYLSLMKKMPTLQRNYLTDTFKSWRKRIKHFFGHDPLKCLCGGTYELIDIFRPPKE